MKQKPHLELRVKGNASFQDDAAVLKALRVKELIAASRKMSADELRAEAGKKTFWMLSENRKVLNRMNDEMHLPTASERASKLRKEEPELKDEALETEVFRLIYQDVIQGQMVVTDTLLSLADRRALSIKQYLVEVLQLNHKQISVIKAQKNELTGSVVKMGLEAI